MSFWEFFNIHPGLTLVVMIVVLVVLDNMVVNIAKALVGRRKS